MPGRGNHPTRPRGGHRGARDQTGRLIDVPGWLLTRARARQIPPAVTPAGPTSAVFTARPLPMADANALGRSNPGQGVRLVARQARRQCPRRALADGHERSPAVNHGSTVSVTEERRLDRPLLRVGGALGAHLGHGPPDNRGHERSVPDTWVLPFTSANVRCQRAPLAWFFLTRKRSWSCAWSSPSTLPAARRSGRSSCASSAELGPRWVRAATVHSASIHRVALLVTRDAGMKRAL